MTRAERNEFNYIRHSLRTEPTQGASTSKPSMRYTQASASIPQASASIPGGSMEKNASFTFTGSAAATTTSTTGQSFTPKRKKTASPRLYSKGGVSHEWFHNNGTPAGKGFKLRCGIKIQRQSVRYRYHPHGSRALTLMKSNADCSSLTLRTKPLRMQVIQSLGASDKNEPATHGNGAFGLCFSLPTVSHKLHNNKHLKIVRTF